MEVGEEREEAMGFLMKRKAKGIGLLKSCGQMTERS